MHDVLVIAAFFAVCGVVNWLSTKLDVKIWLWRNRKAFGE